MLLSLVLAQTKWRGLTHNGLLGRGTDERDRGKHLQSKPVAGTFSSIAITLSSCLDNVQLDSL